MEETLSAKSYSSGSKNSQKGITAIVALIIIVLLIAGGVIANKMNKSKNSSQKINNLITHSAKGSITRQAPVASASSPSAMQDETVVGEKVIEVDGSNFKFSPKVISVKKGDKVTIDFKNTGGFHNFVIDEFNVKTPTIGTGKEEKVTFIANKTGIFQYYCSVANHKAMGMWGNLTVNP